MLLINKTQQEPVFLTQQCLGVNIAMTHCCLWHPALAGQVQWQEHGSISCLAAQGQLMPKHGQPHVLGNKADAWT